MISDHRTRGLMDRVVDLLCPIRPSAGVSAGSNPVADAPTSDFELVQYHCLPEPLGIESMWYWEVNHQISNSQDLMCFVDSLISLVDDARVNTRFTFISDRAPKPFNDL